MSRFMIGFLAFLLLIAHAPAVTAQTAPNAAATHVELGQGERGSVGDRLIVRLGEGLAAAFADESVRARFHSLIANSPYVEGRIALKRLLMIDAELRNALLGDISWPPAAAALPELELYFPAAEHRDAWQGGPDVDVAVPLGNGVYRVISPNGAVAEIEGGTAPVTPTLLLAASEIDYDDLDSALVGGSRTGPFLEAQGRGMAARSSACSPPQAAGADPSTKALERVIAAATDSAYDTFMTLLRIKNDYEGWPRGSMEIEVFGNIGGGFSACTRVTNIDEDRDYTYTLGTRRVSTAKPTGTTTLDIRVYEDDDTGCSVRSGDDFVGEAMLTESQIGSRRSFTNMDLTLQAKLDPVCGDFTCEAGENPFTCCECASCGNGLCQTGCGENQFNCSFDCTCGNGVCDFGEDRFSCPFDCQCGDGFCDFDEDPFSCPEDCGGTEF